MAPGIRRGEADDRDAILRIWDEQFGAADRRAEAWLDRAFSERSGTTAFVAGDPPVGFLVVGVADPGYASDYVRGALDPEDLPEETAILHMLCVDDGRKGEGIGTRLVRECLAWARGRVDLIVAVSWLREDHVDSAPLFERAGFRRLSTVEGYYRGYREDCPDCVGACTCSAATYARRLSG